MAKGKKVVTNRSRKGKKPALGRMSNDVMKDVVKGLLLDELALKGYKVAEDELDEAADYVLFTKELEPEYSIRSYVQETIEDYPHLLIAI